MDHIVLSALQLDALKEIGNIAAGNASATFSQLVGAKIGMNVTRAGLVPVAELYEELKTVESRIGIHQRILGQLMGDILIVFPRASASELISIVSKETQRHASQFDFYDKDILMEFGNIVSGSYLTTLARMTNMLLMPSVPHLYIDLSVSTLHELITGRSERQYAFIISNELRVEDSTVSIQAFLLPDIQTIPSILKAIGAHK